MNGYSKLRVLIAPVLITVPLSIVLGAAASKLNRNVTSRTSSFLRRRSCRVEERAQRATAGPALHRGRIQGTSPSARR